MPGQGEPPEIKEGDTVVLDILGSEALGQYGLWLTGNGFLSSGLGFIASGIKAELATIEQGEAEGRPADDVPFWLASAARLNRLSLMVDETDCVPTNLKARRCFISKLVESGYLGLLRALRSCYDEREPVSGNLEDAKAENTGILGTVIKSLPTAPWSEEGANHCPLYSLCSLRF
jgi:hypothetical protein